jgi:hypothetical protein
MDRDTCTSDDKWCPYRLTIIHMARVIASQEARIKRLERTSWAVRLNDMVRRVWK